MKYLLDTNICVFLIRSKNTALRNKCQAFAADELAISTITLAELRFGADKSQFPSKNHTALDLFLAPVAVSEFDQSCAAFYGAVRSELERQGTPIGPLDTLIAAHSLRLKIPLVTNNTKEFVRIEGLQVEDWTMP